MTQNSPEGTVDGRPPPPEVRYRGSARLGRSVAASNPFGYLVIKWDALTLGCWKFHSETLRKGEGTIRVSRERSRLVLSFDYDASDDETVTFTSWQADQICESLEAFGWSDSLVAW